MNPSLEGKLNQLEERQEELGALLSDPDIFGDNRRYRDLSIELSEITPIVDKYRELRTLQQELQELQTILKDNDQSIREMAQEELPRLENSLKICGRDLERLLLPKDPNDDRNIFLEIRAGTGGDEAALFAGDLFRMYKTFAESQGWTVEAISHSAGEHGGYKEIIVKIIGRGAYSKLKFESGAHRVQRVPETETQGRIHTSACTVAILPEAEAIDKVDINNQDLRVDTFRASGAGGQHVNRTDSAIRITHLPSGLVVECQDERSQHKNKARAMSVLQARLLEREIRKQRQQEAETRRNLVGSGDRSERIRTYNYPQGRVTDHRINLTLYKLDEILQGDLAQIVTPLISEHQTDLLAAMALEDSH